MGYTKTESMMVYPEWKILELVSFGLETDRDRTEFDEILKNEHLDWGEILYQALRHKVLYLLAFNVVSRNRLGNLPRFLGAYLSEALRVNRHRIKLYRKEAVRVAKSLEERCLRFACTKGISLESTVYEGKGERYMADIDFLIKLEDEEIVTAIMKELGYELGYYDWKTGNIHHFDRRELISYRLNPDHLPTFVRVLDDSIISHIHVDFACSFTWTQCEYQVPVSKALSDVLYQPVPGVTVQRIPVLSSPYQFLFTILHLFREAWIDKWLDLEQDVNLIKFADVIRLWRYRQDTLDTDEFRELLKSLEIVEPVAWVLVHLDQTLGTSIAKALEVNRCVSQDFLNSAGNLEERQRRWRGTMRDRLQARNRREFFEIN